ncbi:hypothetical protein [Nocardioides sp. Leaf307]|uniref:hypothetical protein n=1 Tax=Nocardioides sp. Leaf307 TaxID=1736331 RepID=UPI0007034FF7|nr:hypothetical protein [Nocardioides sp. Leaf307]KQQ41747.1 hypothetical protein ASF50_12545 [Nocardioides sp. Leaf307]
MSVPRRAPSERRALLGALAGLVALVLAAGLVTHLPRWLAGDDPVAEGVGRPGAAPGAGPGPGGGRGDRRTPEQVRAANAATLLPNGTRRVFGADDFLVAYYGTAQTPALGVLGEGAPEQVRERLDAAARPFARPGSPVQPVYELIVTIADAGPGDDGDYAHDVPRAEVERWIAAARRHDALLLLDLQPGRTGFLDTARRWEWALREPHVGLALDPEWRMGRREVPGQVIGSVGAREVDRTSAWLAGLVRRWELPQKLFVLHQFRTDMVRDLAAVTSRRELATVQHVDGFGAPREKLATYRAVVRPQQFRRGFKLFYDEDVDLMGPREVHAIRPAVRFVSYQ